ncbi:hypothetical protein HYDPIDRAFT_116361 [Hydnomerulius pinastri MD-312]|uniref:DUF6533 domain-containing protein n=1 Tax=Hydnomerulius pinastri MD-312 TaxID=994086 RepID=A0A0C9WBD2_9AGAM|nr:hypothetical protein HYDPIDRAFT_116361 [Hydnomerulius pinastri MD-312]
MSTMSLADLQALYESTARIVYTTRICQFVPSVLMVYDHILSFDQEVEHIWGRALSAPTVLYILLRYLGTAYGIFSGVAFLMAPMPEIFGKVFIYIQGWPSSIIVWLVQIILQMRIHALYGRKKLLFYLVTAAFVIEIAAMSTILIIGNVLAETTNEPLPGLNVCTDTNTPKIFYSYWLPVIGFEGILCILALYAGFEHSQNRFKGPGGGRLVDAIIKGNVLYFVFILVACIVNAVMWQTLPYQWLEVPEGFPECVEVIVGCRLLLHLRQTFARTVKESRGDTYVLSELYFIPHRSPQANAMDAVFANSRH